MASIHPFDPNLNPTCSVCLGTPQDDLDNKMKDAWVAHSDLLHPAHLSCLRSWAISGNKSTCPVCRTPINSIQLLTTREKIKHYGEKFYALVPLAAVSLPVCVFQGQICFPDPSVTVSHFFGRSITKGESYVAGVVGVILSIFKAIEMAKIKKPLGLLAWSAGAACSAGLAISTIICPIERA